MGLVIVNVIGGLGNQMFQYATGRSLALRLGAELRVDTRMFDGYHLHNGYELEHVFSVRPGHASAAEVHKLVGWRDGRLGRRLLRKGLPHWMVGRQYLGERVGGYDPAFESVTGDCYLFGHWQSERYFAAHADAIRSDFRFPGSLEGENARVAERVAEGGAVSLHVRRGDYVTDKKTNSAHGTCSLGYYRRAMAYIEARVPDPVYFVFSDDMEWVRDNLEFSAEYHFVGHNDGARSHLDMRLMSLCDHHVIANSSFSWWGAWLGQNPGKIVVAPARWMQGRAVDMVSRVPREWVLVEG